MKSLEEAAWKAGATVLAHLAIVALLASACASNEPSSAARRSPLDGGQDAPDPGAPKRDANRADVEYADARPDDFTRSSVPGCYAKADALVGYLETHADCQRNEDCTFTVQDVLLCMLPDRVAPGDGCRGNLAINVTADRHTITSQMLEMEACLGGSNEIFWHAPSCTKINGKCCSVSCGAAPTVACIAGRCEIVPNPTVGVPADAGKRD